MAASKILEVRKKLSLFLEVVLRALSQPAACLPKDGGQAEQLSLQKKTETASQKLR